FFEQERQLPANPANQTEVESLRERFPAMVAVAAAGLGAAALAAELDEQYVQELLQDEQDIPAAVEPEPVLDDLSFEPEQVITEPAPAAEPEPEPAALADIEPVAEDDLDTV
ncbi:peptidoglycan-binding protein, partial [Pseudomonas shirazensis]